MGVVACDRWIEEKKDERALAANEMLCHDVYSLPDEHLMVFCPECCEMAESFDLIVHRGRCFFGGGRLRDGSS